MPNWTNWPRAWSAARRPLLWLGNGAKKAGSAAAKLLDMGFGMVTSFNGRGDGA